MQWKDVNTIVEALQEAYVDDDIDLERITLMALRDLILDLPEFSDDPEEIDDALLIKIRELWRDLARESKE